MPPLISNVCCEHESVGMSWIKLQAVLAHMFKVIG